MEKKTALNDDTYNNSNIVFFDNDFFFETRQQSSDIFSYLRYKPTNNGNDDVNQHRIPFLNEYDLNFDYDHELANETENFKAKKVYAKKKCTHSDCKKKARDGIFCASHGGGKVIWQ
jgi:hypothetical protein